MNVERATSEYSEVAQPTKHDDVNQNTDLETGSNIFLNTSNNSMYISINKTTFRICLLFEKKAASPPPLSENEIKNKSASAVDISVSDPMLTPASQNDRIEQPKQYVDLPIDIDSREDTVGSFKIPGNDLIL